MYMLLILASSLVMNSIFPISSVTYLLLVDKTIWPTMQVQLTVWYHVERSLGGWKQAIYRRWKGIPWAWNILDTNLWIWSVSAVISLISQYWWLILHFYLGISMSHQPHNITYSYVANVLTNSLLCWGQLWFITKIKFSTKIACIMHDCWKHNLVGLRAFGTDSEKLIHEFKFAVNLTCYNHVRRNIKDQLLVAQIPDDVQSDIINDILGWKVG